MASSRHLVNFFETLRIMISFRGEWVRSRLVVITLFLPGRCFSVVSKITTSEATATWATAAAKKKKTFGGRNRTLGVWQTSSSLTVSEIIFLALCFSFFVLFSTSTAAAAVESDGCDFDSFWRCPNNIQGLMNRSLERKRKSPEHINLTSRRFPSPIPRPMTTHRLDTRFLRWQVFLLLPFFWRLRGRSNGDVNPSDSQAKRSHTSVFHVFLWMDIEGIFPFYSIGFFPRAFTLRAMMFAWNWHRNRRHPNFVPSKRRSAWNFRNELYNFFFSLSSFAAATSPSLSTTTVTIKQKNSKLQEKDFFPRSNFEQSSRMTPCQVNWKGLPPLLLV